MSVRVRWCVVPSADFAFEVGSGMIRLSMKDDGLGKALATGGKQVQAVVAAHMEYWAPRVESDMKTNAPWTDRTGNARNGLAARAFHDSANAGIILYHQVPYGIWLEVAHSGKYAIIDPTIQADGPVVMADLRGKLSKMRFT